MSDWLDRMVFGGLLVGIWLSPWLFGSVERYAIDLLGLLMIALLGLAAIKGLIDGRWQVWYTPLHWCLLLFLLIALLQTAPMPWAVRDLPSAMRAADPLLSAKGWNRISLDPPATLRAAMKLSILVGYFFIAAQSLRTNRRLSVLIHSLVLLGLVLALVGILHQLTFNGKILWIRSSEFAQGSFGPFVNRNHFAGFMEMLVPLPLAMVFSRGVSRDRWILYGFCGIVMATALVYSLSRGGLLGFGMEMLLLPLLAERERRRRRHLKDWQEETTGRIAAGALGEREVGAASLSAARMVDPGRPEVRKRRFSQSSRSRPAWRTSVVMIALIMTAVGFGLAWIGLEPLTSRLADTRSEFFQPSLQPQSRPATWMSAIRVFLRNPICGAGLGAFPRAYPMVDPSPGVYFVGEAHNDYLQVLADTGLLGGGMGILFLFFLVSMARRALARPERLERAAALGGTVGVCGILVHSLVDFNLQITSNGLLFLILVAMLASGDLRAGRQA